MKIWKNYLFNLFILIVVSCLLVCLTNKFILTSEFFTRNGQYLAARQEQELLAYNLIQKWIYLSAVAYLLARIVIIAFILYTALYLSEVSVSFKKIIREVTIAELVLLLPAIIKFFHFYLMDSGFTLEDWHRYYALSALQLAVNVPADWHYALQTLNVFEVLYWFALAAGIRKVTGMDYDASLKVVVRSYLPALFIWVCLVSFFTIIYFPATS